LNAIHELGSVDIVTVRRSFRCFWFGLLGLVPIIGVGLAWQALRLSGQMVSPFTMTIWGTLALATPFLFVSVNWPPIAVAALMVAVIDASVDFRRSRATQSGAWNPAQAWAWTGVMLARSGLGFTAVLISGFIAFVIANILLSAG
jgi:hypothetical protein